MLYSYGILLILAFDKKLSQTMKMSGLQNPSFLIKPGALSQVDVDSEVYSKKSFETNYWNLESNQK